MKDIINIFKHITTISRCSGTYTPFITFIKEFAQNNSYECIIDNYNNILCKKSNSKATLALQSHYDIVCLIDNTVPELIEEDGYFKAKNSTLGADNGIGCAYMLTLMSQNYDCEYIFTSDEEIGLIGANNIALKLQTSQMLNLDSEEEGDICIGCAGGVDIIATNSNASIVPNDENYDLYEISISKLKGGHSGVNIHENIPNALKLVAKSIKEAKGKLLDLNGGERINSIPVNVKAIIASKTKPLKNHENMIIEKIDSKSKHLKLYSDDIIDFIYNFENGVRGFNKEVGVVQTSINLAISKTGLDSLELQLSARSMDNDGLKEIKDETRITLEKHGFKVKTSGKYPAWKPDINSFTNKVLQIYTKHNKNAKIGAIHAGLECAIFKAKYPNIDVASIGPNIYNPHSNGEKVEIKSIHTLFSILKDIVEAV